MDKAFFSTSEVAKILGVSRISVFKKIKSGEIKAKKIGRNFIIERKDLAEILESVLREDKKKEIEQVVAKAVKEYGETFRLLGKE
ncbi:MAG: hypothetical protein UU71_C0001G0018 [Parcubacteria group bacterium GW2011_GWB1_41_6]|nr:MAG: hypothetical protein UU71_C0001G0018 [Parcubacteria group bacterium GW2011_GWB1_41_6]KKS34509.1 MAG: hypothetical protein UU96_C0003G0018 [Parcubacteria group bacterium GW2011_GWC2_42_13]KKS57894.1 MAG: hypothetical protein UV22_C0010G0002 [Parcubacteria group bacterium GW2011_GWA2_42_35]